jgi:hypothetical protein
MSGPTYHMKRRQRRSGYSLVFVSVLLTVAAIAFAAMLPGQEAGDINYKSQSTVEKLEKVETNLTGFMALNGRLPCPADGSSSVNTATFGKETDALGDGLCTGAPMGPDAGTGNVVAGTIPTNSLHLDDSYAFDEWGRRITYVVDTRATKFSSCVKLQNFPANNGLGGIAIESSTGGSVIDNAMHAFISHGPGGHGAFPAQGSTVAGRINAGSTDSDELTNAGVDSSFVYNTTNFTSAKVMKDRTSTFGDLVYYAQYQKNTCCVGGAVNCTIPGFRINGTIANGYAGYRLAYGDVNGDGISDLIIMASTSDCCAAIGKVYVVFGTKSGFPNPLPLSSLNGSNGFYITDSATGTMRSLAAGDVNNDGYADVVIGYDGTVDIFYGLQCGGAWGIPCAASYDINTLTACQATRLTNGSHLGWGTIAVGDVNGDGIPDIVVNDPSMNSNKGYVYVVFGRNNSCPGSPTFTSPYDVSAITNPKGAIIQGSVATAIFGNTLAVGDINHDGIGDLVIGDWLAPKVYVVAGQSTANWPSSVAAGSLSGIPAGGCPTLGNPGNNTCGFVITSAGGNEENVAVGDVTGDGIADIFIGSTGMSGVGQGNGNAFVVNGHANPWNATYTIATLVSGGMALQFSDSETLGGSVAIADVNGDGVGDLIFDDPTVTGNGSVFVLFGGASLATRNLDSSPPNGMDGFRLDCPSSANGSCGTYLLGFDMNGDNYADVIVSAGYGNVTGTNEEGWTYVVFGKSSGWRSPYSLSTIY